MKVLHVLYGYPPDPVGGTEIYVGGLAAEQSRLGMECEIAAPGVRDETYEHQGVRVHRFSVGVPSLSDLYGEGDPAAAASFTRVLQRSSPDVVHLHAYTSAVSLLLLRSTKARGIPVVFTYHTPTVSCQRGTLLRWGREICDGHLDTRVCSRCALQGMGLPSVASWGLGSLPSGFGKALGRSGFVGKPFTALRMTELVSLRHQSLRQFLSEVTHVVAVCDWVRDLVLRNGVPDDRVTLSRQGLSRVTTDAGGGRKRDDKYPTRVAFVGRIHATKGVAILISALRTVPRLTIEVDIFGIVQGAEGIALQERLAQEAAADPRIHFRRPLASQDVVRTLPDYDALAVPSQWLETGPLVVYEALAAGIPVIGSNLGGIAELVAHERNGLLVAPDSVPAWAEALRRIVEEPELLARLRTGISPPRTMLDAARELMPLYLKLTVDENRVSKTNPVSAIHESGCVSPART